MNSTALRFRAASGSEEGGTEGWHRATGRCFRRVRLGVGQMVQHPILEVITEVESHLFVEEKGHPMGPCHLLP